MDTNEGYLYAKNAKGKKDKKEHISYLKRRKIISILSLIAMIIFFIVIFFAVGKPLIEMLSSAGDFRAWVDSHGVLGRLAMIGMMVLQVVVAIIPGEPMEVGAGYAFGSIEGMALCLVGAVIGSTMIFLFTKRFGIKLVEAFIGREEIASLGFIKNSKRLDVLVFILFLIPGTPKDVLTYFIGITPMKLHSFLILTTIARIPSVITSTFAGDALGMQDYTLVIWVFVITGTLSLVGLLLYRIFTKKKAAAQAQNIQADDISDDNDVLEAIDVEGVADSEQAGEGTVVPDMQNDMPPSIDEKHEK